MQPPFAASQLLPAELQLGGLFPQPENEQLQCTIIPRKDLRAFSGANLILELKHPSLQDRGGELALPEAGKTTWC